MIEINIKCKFMIFRYRKMPGSKKAKTKGKEPDADAPNHPVIPLREYLVGDLVIILCQKQEWPSMVSGVKRNKVTVNWLYKSKTM